MEPGRRSGTTPAAEPVGVHPCNLDTISTESPSTGASLVGLADCPLIVSHPRPPLPPIDVRCTDLDWAAHAEAQAIEQRR